MDAKDSEQPSANTSANKSQQEVNETAFAFAAHNLAGDESG